MTAKIQSKVYRFAVYAGAFFSMAVLLLIVGYILIKGIPHLTPELFAWEYNSNNVSMMPSIINTLLMTMISLIVCVPLGIGAAIYLTEYAMLLCFRKYCLYSNKDRGSCALQNC